MNMNGNDGMELRLQTTWKFHFCPPRTVRSREIFRDFVSGKFGTELISDYIVVLGNFPHLRIPSVASTTFSLALQAITDSWRRFSLPMESYPFILFNLCGVEHKEFLEEYFRTQKHAQACKTCCDLEFSHPILHFIAPGSDWDSPLVKSKVLSIQHMLDDIRCYTPISSDPVECLHGYTQNLLHRWRGCKPSDPHRLWTLAVRPNHQILRSLSKLAVEPNRRCSSRAQAISLWPREPESIQQRIPKHWKAAEPTKGRKSDLMLWENGQVARIWSYQSAGHGPSKNLWRLGKLEPFGVGESLVHGTHGTLE